MTTGRGAHVSDERLIEACLDRGTTATEDVHFAHCDACAARRQELEQLLRDVGDAVASEADAAFSDERLATQRARILHRIEQDGRPARVIAFPALGPSEPLRLRERPAARWIAGAAAAGLILGLLAGHLAHDLPSLTRSSRTVFNGPASRPAPQPVARAVSASLNDEEFLGEIEHALEGPAPGALRPLNDLTPQ